MHLSARGKNTDYTKLETALHIYHIPVLRAHGQSRFNTTAHRRRYNSSKIDPHCTIKCVKLHFTMNPHEIRCAQQCTHKGQKTFQSKASQDATKNVSTYLRQTEESESV